MNALWNIFALSPPTLEERITKGRAQYLTFFKLNEQSNGLRIGLTSSPETSTKPDQALEFTAIGTARIEWHDRDDASMETLMGATEASFGTGFLYCLNTDQREITLTTQSPPTIQHV